MGDSKAERARVVAVARAAVSSLAPEELLVFDALAERLTRDPERGLREDRRREDVLGFGVDAALPLLTPVAVAVAAEVLREVAVRVAEARRLKHADRTRLTAAQLTELHGLAHRKALAARLGEARATALADAVVAALAMSSD